MRVGSSAITTFGSTASARAIATRCRWPPDSSCGYLAAMSLRRHEPDGLESSWTRSSTFAPTNDAVDPKRTLEVVAHGLDGVQRAERVLEDHLHLRAIAEHSRRRRSTETSLALEEDLAAARFVEACEQPRDGALAAAALADERGDRPGMQLKRDVVHRVDVARSRDAARSEAAWSARATSSVGAHRAASTRWHATSCPGSTCAQHGPLGRLPGEQRGVLAACSAGSAGGSGIPPAGREVRRRAGNPGQPLDRARAAAGTTAGAPACTGCRGSARAARPVASSTISPAYMIAIRCAISSSSERSWVMKSTEKPSSRWSSLDLLQDLALHDHVERGRRLVHDDELGLERERHAR